MSMPLPADPIRRLIDIPVVLSVSVSFSLQPNGQVRLRYYNKDAAVWLSYEHVSPLIAVQTALADLEEMT